MKITEMTTVSFADFVDSASESIGNIMQNESIVALMNPEAQNNPIHWMTNAAKALCGPCRNDIFVVLGALCGKTAEEIAQQNILVTIGSLRNLYNDIKAVDIPE